MKYLTATLFLASAALASAVDFKSQVEPILRVKCFECHSVAKGKTKGDVALDTAEKLKEIMGPGAAIVPGEPKKSTFYISLTLPDDEDDVMPPKGKNRLNAGELALVENWIKEGANLTPGGAAPATAAAPAAPVGGAPQSWKNIEGTVIEAIFMGLQGDGVLLKIPSTGVTHL
ncbi:MAG TPA: c-type cytochrome domain-containing protein, partial [Prosthecobacter sp.]|nr:c-type cytochrome domain-containing protein [Prosthecobacter sp.]